MLILLVCIPVFQVEKVVVHTKGASTVGFIHFAQRSVSGKTQFSMQFNIVVLIAISNFVTICSNLIVQ